MSDLLADLLSDSNDPGLVGSTLEVGGVIVDDHGNEWATPGDNVEDYDDLYAKTPYSDMPVELTGKFWVQGIPVARYKEYAARGFAPVYQSEMRIPEEALKMTGETLDSHHIVGDMMLVKIPHAYRDRWERAKIAHTKRRLKEVEPTKDMMSRSQQHVGILSKSETDRSVLPAAPSSRQGAYAKE